MADILITTYNEKITSKVYSFFMEHLPKDMQMKIRRFKRWEDAQACLFGKILLIEGLKQYGFKANCLIDIKYSKYDRPYLSDSIDFNISHSGGLVICAIAENCRIGIDLEEIRQVDTSSFKNQFTIAEWHQIELNKKNSFNQFFNFWTMKEAVIKADGRGLNISLNEICTNNNSTIKIENNHYYVKELNLGSHYSCHIASSKMIKNLQEPQRLCF